MVQKMANHGRNLFVSAIIDHCNRRGHCRSSKRCILGNICSNAIVVNEFSCVLVPVSKIILPNYPSYIVLQKSNIGGKLHPKVSLHNGLSLPSFWTILTDRSEIRTWNQSEDSESRKVFSSGCYSSGRWKWINIILLVHTSINPTNHSFSIFGKLGLI